MQKRFIGLEKKIASFIVFCFLNGLVCAMEQPQQKKSVTSLINDPDSYIISDLKYGTLDLRFFDLTSLKGLNKLIPREINRSKVTFIDLKGNHLSSLDVNDLTLLFPNVTMISANSNRIEQLLFNSRKPNEKLEYLDLSSNNLSKVGTEKFRKAFPNLRQLFLSENAITSLPEEYIEEIKKKNNRIFVNLTKNPLDGEKKKKLDYYFKAKLFRKLEMLFAFLDSFRFSESFLGGINNLGHVIDGAPWMDLPIPVRICIGGFGGVMFVVTQKYNALGYDEVNDFDEVNYFTNFLSLASLLLAQNDPQKYIYPVCSLLIGVIIKHFEKKAYEKERVRF